MDQDNNQLPLNIRQAADDLNTIINTLMDDDDPIGDKGELVDDLEAIRRSILGLPDDSPTTT